ncbi:FAD-dependent oxidoreductase [Nocardia fluminea]|uniref:FAD-dependent oxidoreductase n=1 Tax=Nocardia fluminea TaxID=134984 RepID=UPI00382B19FE
MTTSIEHLVVVGASLAGLRAVEAARRDGFQGRITLIGEEPHPPHDRSPLSKAYLDGDTPLPGSETLSGVHTLRILDDAAAVREALDRDARTVVVGAEFIGSEVASGAQSRGLPVTIVEAAPIPLVHAVGEDMGIALNSLHA